jgi:hypothetical protein
MYQKIRIRAASRVANRSRRSSSFSRLAKNVSATALSERIPDGAHRQRDPRALGVGAVEKAGVLGTVVRVRHQPCGGVALGDGHAECVEYQLGAQIIAESTSRRSAG